MSRMYQWGRSHLCHCHCIGPLATSALRRLELSSPRSCSIPLSARRSRIPRERSELSRRRVASATPAPIDQSSIGDDSSTQMFDLREKLRDLLDDGWVPGNERRFDVYEEDYGVRFFPFLRLFKDYYFRHEVRNFERIPDSGGALVVLNHGLFSVDPLFLGIDVWEKKNRLIRALTDRRAFKVPYVREVYRKMGVVEGHRETTIEMLRHGELCFAMPGGGLEWGKSSAQKYELLWEDHTGFIITALRAEVPIIPIATIGIDDVFTIPLSFRSGALGGLVRVPLFVFGWGPLPRPVKLVQYVGEPINFAEMGYTPADSEDPATVKELQLMVANTLTEMLKDGLKERQSKWW